MSSAYKREIQNYRPDRVVLGTTARQQIAQRGAFRPEKVILGLQGLFNPSAQSWDWKTATEGAVVGGFVGGGISIITNALLDNILGKQAVIRVSPEAAKDPAKFLSNTFPGKVVQGTILGAVVGSILSNSAMCTGEAGSASVPVLEESVTVSPAPVQAQQLDFTTSSEGMLVPSSSEAGYENRHDSSRQDYTRIQNTKGVSMSLIRDLGGVAG